MNIRRLVVTSGLFLFAGWLTLCGTLLIFRHDLIYPFRDWPDARQVSGVPGATPLSFQGQDGTPITYWQVKARRGEQTVLYFMGNAGSLPSSGPRLAELVHQGYGVIALNYRGAGGAPGLPREADLLSDALALYDRFSGDDRPPVIYGTSLGAAIAVQVAARRPASALILETPFARLCDVAEHRFPVVPACILLPDEHWDSLSAVKDVTAPILILHGDADRVIPLSQGVRLFKAANEPRNLITYPGGRHNDLRLHGAGQDIIAFLRNLREKQHPPVAITLAAGLATA